MWFHNPFSNASTSTCCSSTPKICAWGSCTIIWSGRISIERPFRRSKPALAMNVPCSFTRLELPTHVWGYEVCSGGGPEKLGKQQLQEGRKADHHKPCWCA